MEGKTPKTQDSSSYNQQDNRWLEEHKKSLFFEYKN